MDVCISSAIRSPVIVASSEFSTTFPDDANPIGAPWTSPNVANFFDMRTLGGIAFGTAASDLGYPDCYAFHSGFTGDYEIEAGIFRAADVNDTINHEVELHVCMAQDGTVVQSVEFLISVTGNPDMLKWEGENPGAPFWTSLGITLLNAPGAPANGDRMKFRKVGTTLTSFFKSGVNDFVQTFDSFTSPFSTGCPGIATFTRAGGNPSKFCFTDVTIRAL